MKLFLPKGVVFVLFFLFVFSGKIIGQTTGDYRSAANGNWTSLSSWERYDGITWLTPTAGQGWPGQNAGTGAVLIQAVHTISIGNTGISTQPMGIITINSTLNLNSDNTPGGVNYFFDTKKVVVTSGLSPVANINFVNKVNLKLPADAVLLVGTSGLKGDCSDNQDIYIGTSIYAYCSGGGPTVLHFSDLMASGGSLDTTISSNSSVCENTTINLAGEISNTAWTILSYSWSIIPPSGATITASTQNVSIPNALLGTYTVSLNITAKYGPSNSYANLETAKVIVNSKPGTPTITAGSSTTFCAVGNVTLTSSTGTSYLWSTGATTQSISPTISGSYTVEVTNANGCQSASSLATAVVVNPVPVITTQPSSQLDCEGASVKFKVIASGTGLTYTWQYKRPTDASFITLIGIIANTSYPSVGEIKIDNVGSAQYPDGTQFQVIVSNGSCTVTSSVATLTVNSITGISPIATNVVKCYGTNYSYTVSTSYPANVVSYRWKKSVASGVWNEISDGGAYSGATTATLTITGGTPAESAEYRVYITFNNSTTQCSVDSSTRTRKITFLPQLIMPAVAIIQPSCSTTTGTITVAVQTPTDVYSFDNGGSFQSSNVKSGLTPGSYNVIVKNIGGCLSSTKNVVLNAVVTTTYNGATWSTTPDLTMVGIINSNTPIASDVNLCSCTVNSGINAVINSGVTLKLQEKLTVNGSLTFENNASLVQVNDAAVNSGNINYKRHTSPVRRYDFTYWSSPVGGQTLYNLSPNTLGDKYYSYVPDLGWKIWYNGAKEMEPGEGYIIRAPQTFSITTAAVDVNPMFIGKPNNGVIPLTLSGDKLYLLGNPYPSAINADTFLDVNSAVLEGTLYFWTHNTAIQLASNITDGSAGSGTYAYTSDDYATYNRTGGVATRVSTTDPADTGGLPPAGKIAAAQGFFAPASTTGGTVIFNNSMRMVGGTSGINNLQFFKVSPTSKTSSDAIVATEKNRVWLNLTNKEGVFKQTLVGYLAGATNNYEGNFDGVTYDGNQFVDFYSINQGVNLSIQGRALPFEKLDTVSLGYKSTIKGEFQISIDHTDGILSAQQIFIEDKDLKVLHDLKKEPYIFNTPVGVFNNRFVLRYIDKNAVQKEVAKTLVLNEPVLVSVQHNEITVSAATELIAKISLYDVSGKLIYENAKIAARDFVIQLLVSSHQMLIVRVVLENEEVVSTKIIY